MLGVLQRLNTGMKQTVALGFWAGAAP
jgi:hypothetical protein